MLRPPLLLGPLPRPCARASAAVKTGVLRFGPVPPDDCRLPPNSSPMTSATNANANFRPQPNSLMSANIISSLPVAGQPPPPPPPPNQMGQLTPQPVSMVKAQKKQRKDGSNEFESNSRDRDDVQSPAYSDISDDSTPVAESDMNGKYATHLHSFAEHIDQYCHPHPYTFNQP